MLKKDINMINEIKIKIILNHHYLIKIVSKDKSVYTAGVLFFVSTISIFVIRSLNVNPSFSITECCRHSLYIKSDTTMRCKRKYKIY